MLWVVLVLLCLAALGFVIWPLYRGEGRRTTLLAIVIVLIAGSSVALYHFIGQPNVPSGAGTAPDVEAMVASLEARLEKEPDDINGWLMLGRSYQTMERYDEAVSAFETAIDMENGQNAQTLVALAIVLLEKDGGDLSERAAGLFENALAIEPNNSNALFYGGGAAARRGNTELAADRWEMLLALDATPEIQDLLQRKINEWRGLPPPPSANQPLSQTIVSVSLSLSAEARAGLPADATVYLIARDPAQPSPPIAVKPLRLADFPLVVSMSDRDAMMPGRPLSGFIELEIVARVSVSGNPMAQSGDWSGSLKTSAASTETIDLVINQKIP